MPGSSFSRFGGAALAAATGLEGGGFATPADPASLEAHPATVTRTVSEATSEWMADLLVSPFGAQLR
ncbi:hypothetical protein ACWEO2_20330 [Nocardia sp. NPDC004278]